MKTDPSKAVDMLWKLVNSSTKQAGILDKKNDQLQEQINELEEEINEMKDDGRDNVEKILKS